MPRPDEQKRVWISKRHHAMILSRIKSTGRGLRIEIERAIEAWCKPKGKR